MAIGAVKPCGIDDGLHDRMFKLASAQQSILLIRQSHALLKETAYPAIEPRLLHEVFDLVLVLPSNAWIIGASLLNAIV
jgi:hypothetical protein